jgi:hypothetical protein
MISTLIIAYDNFDGVQSRISELRQFEAKKIFVFLDGFNLEEVPSNSRESLVKFLRTSRDTGVITGLYEANVNLGVGVAVPTALDWFFSNVEFGMVLEDDCRVLTTFPSVICSIPESTLKDSLICLSNPKSEISLQDLYFYVSPFFSSWGWICNKDLWQKNRVSSLNFRYVVSSVLSIRQVALKRRLLLLIAWSEVWFSLRRNQESLWAFRFTINLVRSKQQILYSSVKAVQHQPSGSGMNIKINPVWDSELPENYKIEYKPSSFEATCNPMLNDYIAVHVHGASFKSLLLRFGYKVYKNLVRF